MAADHNAFANLIWQIADLLRGPSTTFSASMVSANCWSHLAVATVSRVT